jgi:threonine aldolase
MRAAMAAAPLGDDVFGDDPSVNALQEKIAALLGFEAALFVPTGTQSNLCGVLSHCQRGDEYIVGQMQHCYRWEGGGARGVRQRAAAAAGPPAGRHAGAGRHRGGDQAGRPALRAHAPAGAGETRWAARCCRRPTWSRRRAGAVARDWRRTSMAPACSMPPWRRPRRRERCAQRGAPHRRNFDSVSVCFSKGLGAPVGSALCGSKELIARARRIRKMAGGAMRQSGVLAAAASYALDHNVERLADDQRIGAPAGRWLAGHPGPAGRAAADQHPVRRPGRPGA